MELKIKVKIFLDKLISNSFWIPIIIAVSIIYFVGGKESDFTSLIEIICAILASVISIIVYAKIPNIKNEFVKYLGVGFLYYGIISFIEIFIINSTTHNNYEFIINMSITYFEITIIILSVILYRKNASFLVSNIIFAINLLCIFIMFGFVYLSIMAKNIHAENAYIISILILIILILITIVTLIIDKSISNKDDKIWLMGIISFFLIYVIINFIGLNLSINTTYPQSICKLLGFIIAYKYAEEKLLNNSYRYTLYELIAIQKTRQSMNNNLRKKERSLIESRMNVKKGEERYEGIIESISEGILIFENNILMYINKNGMEHIFHKVSGEFNEINLNYILEVLTNNKIEDKEISEGFIKEVIIENREEEKINMLLTLKNTSNIEKILVIKNTEYIYELKKLREEREKVKVIENIKDEFYANISHELRTPINVVSSALQLNNLMLEKNELKEMSKNNIIIRRNCLRLIRTINNFIDTNRISEGFLEPNRKVYNIVNIIEDVVLACNKYMILMDNQLVFDTDLENIYVPCDRNHIERIMLNILSNSLKYGEFGGRIDVVIKSNENEVEINVRNDAPRIPEEKRKIIFEKFTKLDSSLARPSEGSGLGLYLTKELVELNGGTIKMNSDISVGNLFDIRFPFKFQGESWELNKDGNDQNLQEKVNIEFSDIYFN